MWLQNPVLPRDQDVPLPDAHDSASHREGTQDALAEQPGGFQVLPQLGASVSVPERRPGCVSQGGRPGLQSESSDLDRG